MDGMLYIVAVPIIFALFMIGIPLIDIVKNTDAIIAELKRFNDREESK